MSAAEDLEPPFPDDDEQPAMVTKLLLHLSADEYHADPCAVPSLSSSIAHVLDNESPLHAHARHPRLGDVRRPPTKSLDAGSLAHALLLGDGKEIEVIDADDYRTNAAKAAREMARECGKIPVLVADYEAASLTAAVLKQKFAAHGIVLDGQSEVTALWTERASNGNEVQCRGMIDHLKLPIIYELKSIRSAKPSVCAHHVDSYGYAIQRAAYVSAIEHNRPDLAGRVKFVFVFFELEWPHAVTPVPLSGAFREIGERRWRRAVDRWEECTRTQHWPDYAPEVTELEPPAYALAKDMQRQMAAAPDAEEDERA